MSPNFNCPNCGAPGWVEYEQAKYTCTCRLGKFEPVGTPAEIERLREEVEFHSEQRQEMHKLAISECREKMAARRDLAEAEALLRLARDDVGPVGVLMQIDAFLSRARGET